MSESSAEHFLRVLGPALRQSAGIARALEGRVQNRPKAGEETAVKAALTIADSASQEALLVPLREHFPQVALRAEEETPTAELFASDGDPLVVIDPIDGTLRFYLQAEGPYSILIGLAEAGRYVASLVALPREGIFFDGVAHGPARRARPGKEPRAVHADGSGRGVLVSPDLPEPVARRLRERGYDLAAASGGALSVAPLIPGICAGLRLANTENGISIRGRIGALVASRAGARIERDGGLPFPQEIDAPADALLVAAEEADLDALRWALDAWER